jgi:archaellum component FlaG (FlaF/FlaG flagellin family)
LRLRIQNNKIEFNKVNLQHTYNRKVGTVIMTVIVIAAAVAVVIAVITTLHLRVSRNHRKRNQTTEKEIEADHAIATDKNP